MEDPAVLLERNLYGHALGKAIREGSFGTRLGKRFETGNVFFGNRAKGLFLSVYVDDIKWQAKQKT